MYNPRMIITGIIIFIILALYPVWNVLIGSGGRSTLLLEVPADSKRCVMPVEYMKANHMALLNEWRDSAARSGDRSPVTVDMVKYQKSLSRTCLKCHSNKAAFCDRCHGYLSITPSCWNCHYYPVEKKSETNKTQ